MISKEQTKQKTYYVQQGVPAGIFSSYGLIPPWHLHLIFVSIFAVVNSSHIDISVQVSFPDTQVSGLVHFGLLSVHALRRKHVLIPRKLKQVKSLQSPFFSLQKVIVIINQESRKKIALRKIAEPRWLLVMVQRISNYQLQDILIRFIHLFFKFGFFCVRGFFHSPFYEAFRQKIIFRGGSRPLRNFLKFYILHADVRFE